MGGEANLPNLASGEKCVFALELAHMQINAPRRLSIEATRAFQEIYQEEFGESLSDDEAQHRGLEVLRFFDILNQSDGDRTKLSN